jgi:hypothetical protein
MFSRKVGVLWGTCVGQCDGMGRLHHSWSIRLVGVPGDAAKGVSKDTLGTEEDTLGVGLRIGR